MLDTESREAKWMVDAISLNLGHLITSSTESRSSHGHHQLDSA